MNSDTTMTYPEIIDSNSNTEKKADSIDSNSNIEKKADIIVFTEKDYEDAKSIPSQELYLQKIKEFDLMPSDNLLQPILLRSDTTLCESDGTLIETYNCKSIRLENAQIINKVISKMLHEKNKN